MDPKRRSTPAPVPLPISLESSRRPDVAANRSAADGRSIPLYGCDRVRAIRMIAPNLMHPPWSLQNAPSARFPDWIRQFANRSFSACHPGMGTPLPSDRAPTVGQRSPAVDPGGYRAPGAAQTSDSTRPSDFNRCRTRPRGAIGLDPVEWRRPGSGTDSSGPVDQTRPP